jgi:hypothetical protein
MATVSPDELRSAFLDRVAEWWPMDRYSVYGATSTAAVVDGVLGESSRDGAAYVWGRVVDDTGDTITFDWSMSAPPNEEPTVVLVEFLPFAGGSSFRLSHSGWSTGPVGIAQYEKYRDWPVILSHLSRLLDTR